MPEGLGEEALEVKLFGNQPGPVRAVPERPQPDWKRFISNFNGIAI